MRAVLRGVLEVLCPAGRCRNHLVGAAL